jgi:hypothetical protein
MGNSGYTCTRRSLREIRAGLAFRGFSVFLFATPLTSAVDKSLAVVPALLQATAHIPVQ